MTIPAGVALGHHLVGTGEVRVVVLNDWMCDTSTWDGARPYLDTERFSWAFADVRGYGRSRGLRGDFTVREIAGDVLALADALEWPRLAVIGHSMSTLAALQLAQHHAHRITRTVLLTPPPPGGFGGDEAALDGARKLARADEETQRSAFHARSGGRLSVGWAAFKAARWQATSDREASAAYAAMFVRDGVPDPTTTIRTPVLAITGEEDAPPMRREAVLRALSPICLDLEVTPIAHCGHYPMQEAPPLLVSLVERFLGK